jgi:hypothetical protein
MASIFARTGPDPWGTHGDKAQFSRELAQFSRELGRTLGCSHFGSSTESAQVASLPLENYPFEMTLPMYISAVGPAHLVSNSTGDTAAPVLAFELSIMLPITKIIDVLATMKEDPHGPAIETRNKTMAGSEWEGTGPPQSMRMNNASITFEQMTWLDKNMCNICGAEKIISSADKNDNCSYHDARRGEHGEVDSKLSQDRHGGETTWARPRGDLRHVAPNEKYFQGVEEEEEEEQKEVAKAKAGVHDPPTAEEMEQLRGDVGLEQERYVVAKSILHAEKVIAEIRAGYEGLSLEDSEWLRAHLTSAVSVIRHAQRRCKEDARLCLAARHQGIFEWRGKQKGQGAGNVEAGGAAHRQGVRQSLQAAQLTIASYDSWCCFRQQCASLGSEDAGQPGSCRGKSQRVVAAARSFSPGQGPRVGL